MNKTFFMSVDIGTGSARCAIHDEKGKNYAFAEHAIKIWNYKDNYYEQSSHNIWNSVIKTMRLVIEQFQNHHSLNPNLIKTINFDATCSLVALDGDYQPVSVNENGAPEQNIILWMDHRANKQASRINATKHSVLKYVGGQVSPEMQIPKILWIKQNLPQQYQRVKHFIGLPDFLTLKASGKLSRSICSLTCKWNYLSKERKFDDDYFKLIGLEDIVANGYKTIFNKVKNVGDVVGQVTPDLATRLGLSPDCLVLTSLIDAHCGGIGILGAHDIDQQTINNKIAIIAGTSSCHMASSHEENEVKGVWGPYYDAMLPGFYLQEGGQSTSGAGIDYLIQCHPAYPEAKKAADAMGINVQLYLNKIIAKENIMDDSCLNIHAIPDLLGNRSPLSDPNIAGMILGYNGGKSITNLAKIYLAILQSVGYGTRQIIESLNNNGYNIKEIIITGGLAKNELFLQMHANCSNMPVYLTANEDAVLLGGAILGAYASKCYNSIFESMKNMSQVKKVYKPATPYAAYHNKKYQVYKSLQAVQQKCFTPESN